jgi:hypothetical protein
VIAESIVEALRGYRKGWRRTLDEIGRKRRAELAAWRAEPKA